MPLVECIYFVLMPVPFLWTLSTMFTYCPGLVRVTQTVLVFAAVFT